MSSYRYDHYRRTRSEPGGSLLAWVRELWARRRPKPAEAEVVPFPAAAAQKADPKPDRGGSKAA